jgi:hypothetical protein
VYYIPPYDGKTTVTAFPRVLVVVRSVDGW